MRQYLKTSPEPRPLRHYLVKQEKGVARVHKLYETLQDAVEQCLSSVKACESMELIWFVLSTPRALNDNCAVDKVSD